MDVWVAIEGVTGRESRIGGNSGAIGWDLGLNEGNNVWKVRRIVSTALQVDWGTASFACLEFRVAGKWATERSVFVCDFCRVGAVFECVSAWLSPSFVTGSAQDGFSYRYYFPSSIARNSP